MHIIQQNILAKLDAVKSESVSLRKRAEIVGADHPQKLKHHIDQLVKKGFLDLDTETGEITRSESTPDIEQSWVRIPFYGQASAGPATFFTHESPIGHITVSQSLLSEEVLHDVNFIYALEAKGNSMNNAVMPGAQKSETHPLNNGDYVLVNSNEKLPKDNDFVVSVINGMANIKRFRKDPLNKRIILFSDSKEDREPIIAREDDSYVISGKVVQVIPRFEYA